jgi:LmbE family N-acetylglucosaminyl deacetylase
MSTLIVVAHPDDEVLGCGGLAAALTALGQPVHTCILSGSVDARQHRPPLERLHEDVRAAHRILGLPEPMLGPFPNIAFNTVPHLDLVEFIEAAIRQYQATRIYTHHPGDLNDDHRQLSLACQAAARLSQRDPSVAPLERLAFIEVPSSTDWAFPTSVPGFLPTSFLELGEERLALKLEALAAYQGVMRPFPHPRSEEVVRGLAAVRGGQAGMRYAEAFQVAFDRLKPA